ncbi:MAG: Gfo/Idh/MocA family protein [Anaerolineae bacterium]|jgi:predicted dehydrogenase|nr:Gfo/Idh/MocA family oxidoreductase [Chloroflexota bacterium]
MDKVRVGIVGMGIGRDNALALHGNPRGSVVALCDLIPERMERVAAELQAPVRMYTEVAALCADPEVDAIFVGTPNRLHVPVALQVVAAGKHVMVTKPLADSVAAAEELVAAAEAAGVVNMMSLSTRFSAEVQYLGALREAGRLGEIYYARARSIRRSGIPDWNTGFVEEGGGAFRDMGVHALDAAWWLLGMPQPVTVSGVAGARFGPRGLGYWDYRRPPESFYSRFAADDYGGGFIRFADGTGLQIESFWASHQAPDLNIELFGTEAGARLRPLTLYSTEKDAPMDTAISVPKTGNSFDAVAAHFIACILDGVPCQAPLRHGLVVQRMMEGLLESAAQGREVILA